MLAAWWALQQGWVLAAVSRVTSKGPNPEGDRSCRAEQGLRGSTEPVLPSLVVPGVIPPACAEGHCP